MADIGYRKGTRSLQPDDMDNERKPGDPFPHRDRQRMVADRTHILDGGPAILTVMGLLRLVMMPGG